MTVVFKRVVALSSVSTTSSKLICLVAFNCCELMLLCCDSDAAGSGDDKRFLRRAHNLKGGKPAARIVAAGQSSLFVFSIVAISESAPKGGCTFSCLRERVSPSSLAQRFELRDKMLEDVFCWVVVVPVFELVFAVAVVIEERFVKYFVIINLKAQKTICQGPDTLT
ncbi:hypothetical protein GQX74_010787 [Glossina fuscipes]|nr:hypothetical protein GQX74_010787 [Glossina fuscipes]